MGDDDDLQGLASHQWADNLVPEEKERFRRKDLITGVIIIITLTIIITTVTIIILIFMTIRNGFYSALVKPKLRIISVNNNFCVSIDIIIMIIMIIVVIIIILMIIIIYSAMRDIISAKDYFVL